MSTQPVLDQTGDLNGQETFRLCQLYDAPDFVKEAAVEQLIGPETLRPHLYADPKRRHFRDTDSPNWGAR